jgi:NADH-quinone oxidoreductase subunit E
VTFSPELEARLAELVKRYPPGYKRGALVPMLLYVQDEAGAISEEVVAEAAERLGISTLQVEEVVGYYSMLRRRPAGRHHVQVCTNISCMLRGAEQLYEHAQRQLGLRHEETSADGEFSLEEVECMGACSWAPAIQVNYDFHHNMTPEKFDALVEKLRNRR